jgi:PAS domain S-box-containing protein
MSSPNKVSYWDHRDFLTDLINQLPLHIFWKNTDSVFLGCNNVFARTLGFNSPDSIIGKTDYDLPALRKESDAYREDDKWVIENRKPRLNIEETQTLLDGRKKVLLTNKVPLLDRDDEVVGVLAIYIDITERKQMEERLYIAKEQAEAAQKATANFIANMSHDIKTPVSGIIGVSDMLRKEGVTEKYRQFGNLIYDSAQRLLLLLNDILSLAQFKDQSNDRLSCDEVRIFDLINGLKELVKPNLITKNLDLQLEMDSSLPTVFITDRIKLNRILLNILSNSIKFTGSGRISIGAQLLEETTTDAVIKFTISDTGIGIPEKELNKIFDPFYRGTPSYRATYEGHGLGLFIAKQFILLLKGKIEVTSQLNKGTSFFITVPVRKVKVSTPETKICTVKKAICTPTHVKEAQKKNKKSLALIVEDDALAQRMGRYYLESLGFEVEVAANAEIALNMFKSLPFDIIFSDIGLPGMSGNEFTVLVRYLEKINKKPPMPIIGLSTHFSKMVRRECLDAGMDLVLTKPVNEQKLKEALDRLNKEFLLA